MVAFGTVQNATVVALVAFGTFFLAGFVRFGPGGAGLASLIGIVFLFLTVPTGAHMISRAAQKTGVEFLGGVTWPTERDD